MIGRVSGRRFVLGARQWISLERADRRLLLLALVVVAPVRLALWLLPSRLILRAVRRLEQVSDRHPSPPRARPGVDRIAWAVDASSRRVPQASCLTQAVAGQLLLHRFGYASRLCLGVARDTDGTFVAHAWLERQDRVVIGGSMSTTLTRMPSLQSTRLRNDRARAG